MTIDASPIVDPPEDHQPGLAELSAISILNKQWDAITIEQRGPDGTELLGILAFYACPICFAVVPPPQTNPETGAYVKHFPQEHALRHVKEARDWDYVNQVIAGIRTADAE